MARKLLTVLLTDLKAFTQRTAEGSREDLIALVRQSEELTSPLIRRFGGPVVKTIGDTVLATFESPTNALHCSMLILGDIAACNRSQPPEQQIGMRIALSVGEVELLDGDIFGEAVNLCAHLESVTGVAEIRALDRDLLNRH